MISSLHLSISIFLFIICPSAAILRHQRDYQLAPRCRATAVIMLVALPPSSCSLLRRRHRLARCFIYHRRLYVACCSLWIWEDMWWKVMDLKIIGVFDGNCVMV